MNQGEIQTRLREEAHEADAWLRVLADFSAGRFSRLTCPHCRTPRRFEYLLHQNGCTVRCRECGRFVHGSGGWPDWLNQDQQPPDHYQPVPPDNYTSADHRQTGTGD